MMTNGASPFTEAFLILPVMLDRIVAASGPAMISIGGEAPLFYFGLALLSAQLWRINVALRDPEAPVAPVRGRRILLTLLLAGLAFISLQIAPVKTTMNPAINSAHTIEASLNVPAQVETIFDQACKDCHSHETRWPWYAKVAPVSWIVANDVERGRRAMNLSEWSQHQGSRPTIAQGFLIAACADVESGHMPPRSYQRLHPAARLTPEQTRTLCEWTAGQAKVLRSQATLRRAVTP